MLVANGIEKNFRFLVLEVDKQTSTTLRILQAPSERLIDKVRASDDYVDTLKSLIEELCYKTLRGVPEDDKPTIDMIRAINVITNNLERIADFSVNIVLQTRHLSDRTFIHRYDYAAFFTEVQDALALIVDALIDRDTSKALKLCRTEFNLDELYKTNFERILRELRGGGDEGDLLTCLLILHYLERMGDSLLNIGEAIIFASTGEKLKIHQYHTLQETVAAGLGQSPAELAFESIWGTRSGCRIGKVHDPAEPEGDHDAIFKEGNSAKLQQEKRNIERWESIQPGLAPRIMEFHEGPENSALLMQYLGGATFQHIILSGDEDDLREAFAMIQKTLVEVWEKTLTRQPAQAGYVSQLKSRMDDIFKVHPGFRTDAHTVNSIYAPSFEKLLEMVQAASARLESPFSVFIHGDFNVDNILVNLRERKLHYIDLHRSADQDFVQDVSVFIVSNFRLPVFEDQVRERLERVMLAMVEFAGRFAADNGDATFQARLALGLIRSLITSTRFEFHADFAREMFLRAVYLLERFVAHQGKPWEQFRLPLDVVRL